MRCDFADASASPAASIIPSADAAASLAAGFTAAPVPVAEDAAFRGITRDAPVRIAAAVPIRTAVDVAEIDDERDAEGLIGSFTLN